MPSNDLHKQIGKASRDLSEAFAAEWAVVATDASSEDDDVYVTLPNSEAPSMRIQVHWRVGVQFVGGVAQPKYPQRGDEGVALELDTGELWLIW